MTIKETVIAGVERNYRSLADIIIFCRTMNSAYNNTDVKFAIFDLIRNNNLRFDHYWNLHVVDKVSN